MKHCQFLGNLVILKKGLTYPNKNYKTKFVFNLQNYIFLINEKTSFVCLRKFYTVCTVSTESVDCTSLWE